LKFIFQTEQKFGVGVVFLNCILEVPGSNLSRNTGCPIVFCGFPQTHLEYAG